MASKKSLQPWTMEDKIDGYLCPLLVMIGIAHGDKLHKYSIRAIFTRRSSIFSVERPSNHGETVEMLIESTFDEIIAKVENTYSSTVDKECNVNAKNLISFLRRAKVDCVNDLT